MKFLKSFWLFQTDCRTLNTKQAWGFRIWNLLLILCSGLGLGTVSLAYAFAHNQTALFFSYLSHPLIFLLNVAPVTALIFLLWLLTGRSWIAFLLSGAVTLGLSIGNYFKLLFRDDPLLFQDLLYLREAGAITQGAGYDISPDSRIVTGVLCVLLGTAVLFFLARWRPALRFRLPAALVTVLLCAVCARFYSSDEIYDDATRNEELISQWSATQVYYSKGFVYPFLHSVTAESVRAPDGYVESEAEALLEQYADADIPEDRKVDLITIQLEAFADFSRFGEIPGVDLETPYEIFHALEAESLTGDLITNIFAGGTVDTERCFLTGYVNVENYRRNTNSTAWYLQSQGYTVEGAHPSYKWFYNRENINPYLGIPTNYFIENRYEAMCGGIGYDVDFLPDLYTLYTEDREEGKPYFSFNVTYQGHGPYVTDRVWWGGQYTDGRFTIETENIINNYFDSLIDTQEHLKTLLDSLRTESRPVVVVVYGDHKPWFGDGNSAYQELGINLDISTQEGFRNYYATRWLIWGNDAAKQQLGCDFTGEGEDISSCFLMNEVFELLGWQGSAYLQATDAVRSVVPVVTSTGWYEETPGVFTQELSETGAEAVQTLQSIAWYDSRHFRWQSLLS